MEIHQAQRINTKLRLAITGPSGSGKTYSALLLSVGLVDSWSKIVIIDSENSSAELYAHLGNYSVLPLTPPYSPDRYIEAIRLAERSGFEMIIIDSLSHAWSGDGGILDQQGKAADTKYKGNSWSAWREFTPKHNALVEAILQSKAHVLATIRSKTEYIQVEENGKRQIRKVGLAPIQRDGIEYEFAIVLDLAADHVATASKDRSGIFDGQYFKVSRDTGQTLRQWLNPDAIGEHANNANDASVAATSTPPVPVAVNVPRQSTTPKSTANAPDNAYQVRSAEMIKTAQGREFVKLTLTQGENNIVVWSQELSMMNLVPGTIIVADLKQTRNSLVIEEYYIWKGDAA